MKILKKGGRKRNNILIRNMKNKYKHNFIHRTVLLILLFLILFLGKPVTVCASSVSGLPTSIEAITFDDHKGMFSRINANGQWHYMYCIQRGYPFRSAVSELQMVKATTYNLGFTHYGTIANNIRDLFVNISDPAMIKFFRGWGQWEMNSDHTDAYQTGTDGAPSSSAWQEVFTEFEEDDEDDSFNNRYQGTGSVTNWYRQVRPYITGHEGSVEPFPTKMKEITYQEAGLSMSQVYAMAMTNYYVWDDPDAAGYSETAKYQVKQALDWGTQFGFVSTTGLFGNKVAIIYQDSSASWRTGSFSGSCDGFIKMNIGSQYEAMKLYRQLVWKTTNMRAIPSFASNNPNNCEPIELYWDAEKGLYTATVADANGVLKYFDFEIPGVTCIDNGDGTLTINSANAINGPLTSLPKASRLEPSDGVFKMPNYYRWNLEGKETTYQYTVLVRDLEANYENWYETEETRDRNSELEFGQIYNHSHDYLPACNWFCKRNSTTREENVTHCEGLRNINSCTEHPNAGWVDGEPTRHEHTAECHTHTIECYHWYTCPYNNANRGGHNYWNGQPNTGADACDVVWACGKEHYYTAEEEITGTFIDWQDMNGVYAAGQKIIDPTYAYIKVKTVPHEFPAETDTEILLIADHDEWNDLSYTAPNGKVIRHASHVRVGEKFHLKYIYSYKGASKGFRIEYSLENKPYYQYNYLARMQSPQNTISIYNLRTGLSGDRFMQSSMSVPHAKLVQDVTDIKIRGVYVTPETAYTLSGTYSWDSGEDWNDKVYLDALTTEQYDYGYQNKSAGSITSVCASPMLTEFSVKKENDSILAVWEFDAEPEVFSAALITATSLIDVGEDKNYTRTYFDEAYNYAGKTSWQWNFEDHNQIGGVGYFNTGENGEQVPSHTVYTQNNEYRTYAVRNKVWQSDVDIKVSNFVQNTGAGITEHIYQSRGRDNHDMNYHLYYTIDVENPKATIFADKQRWANGSLLGSETTTTPYDTSSDVYEFDVNTMISWGSTGAAQTGASYGNTKAVDHIKTGTTYIQREIPTVLAAMTNSSRDTMRFTIFPNQDRLIYEDHYMAASISGGDTNRKVTVSVKDEYYSPNEQAAVSDIWPAMNPKNVFMQPQNISGSNNVPDQYNQNDNVLHHTGLTSFDITLSSGETKRIVDSHTKNYIQYDFEYNPDNRNNKVTFPGRRRSVMFFKYSKTNYSYNGNAQSAVGKFRNSAKTQTESYYISQVLFKSNYTSKYMKELEHQGADYIKDYDAQGNLTDAWIDMVNQNKYAIVSAGQGFELRVTLKYENSCLTQYLARYFGTDDAQSDIIGTSNRVQKRYNDIPANSRQYANISALTGKDGRSEPYYRNTERAYISSYSILDRLAVNLVTGSNVFHDLYVFMSDNPDTVYSYSGIYDTPVVFERDINYSDDFSVTTITYIMCVSQYNGVSSNLQKMKFYTSQLTPDKRSPGIVEGMTDVSANGEHSITIWTPVVAATPFDYPSAAQDRYIGDAIELGYTIRTTGADDSIVHIVQ